jgi:hypothetical protein
MAAGEFASSGGGMAAVPSGPPEDSYPSGSGYKLADSRTADQAHIPWKSGAAERVKGYGALADGTPVGVHRGSTEPIGRDGSHPTYAPLNGPSQHTVNAPGTIARDGAHPTYAEVSVNPGESHRDTQPKVINVQETGWRAGIEVPR